MHVVGDLAELEPAAPRPGTGEPTTVTDADLLPPALAGLVGLGQQWDLSRQREAELEQEVERLQRRLARSQERVRALSARVKKLSRRATVLSGRVQQFEATPLRAALRLRARSLRRT